MGVDMCVRIQRSLNVTEPWGPRERTIRIPATLDADRALTAVRAVLHELAVPQPQFGAVCWCGDTVEIPARVPYQRRANEVMARGA